MSLHTYAEKCDEFEEELLEYLSPTQLETLRAQVAKVGESGYKEWYKQNHEEVRKFYTSSPSSRRRKTIWNKPEVVGWYVLASLHMNSDARCLLRTMSQVDLQAGHSYRDMAYRAYVVFVNALTHESYLWPFDNDDPFPS